MAHEGVSVVMRLNYKYVKRFGSMMTEKNLWDEQNTMTQQEFRHGFHAKVLGPQRPFSLLFIDLF